jgi:hypothetical protein
VAAICIYPLLGYSAKYALYSAEANVGHTLGKMRGGPTDHSFGAARVPTEATSLPTISAVHGRHRNEAPTGDGRLSGPEAPPGSSGARRA